jgi:hypothetical protein
MVNNVGFALGEFATLKYHVVSGTLPVADIFSITNQYVIDTNRAPIPGVTAVIQKVVIQ